MPRISETLPPMAPNMNPTGKTTFVAVCSRARCGNPAAVVPVLRIPAIGGAKENALTLPLGFPLCTGHARTVSVGEFTSRKSTFRAKIHSFCRSLGDARPDFRKAWLDFKTRD